MSLPGLTGSTTAKGGTRPVRSDVRSDVEQPRGDLLRRVLVGGGSPRRPAGRADPASEARQGCKGHQPTPETHDRRNPLVAADNLPPCGTTRRRGTPSATRSRGVAGLEDSRPASRAHARREVVQVLLALAIISTVAGVISALAAVWALLLQRRAKPQVVVIIVDDNKASAVEHQPRRKPKRARSSRRARRRLMPWPAQESGQIAAKISCHYCRRSQAFPQDGGHVIRGNDPLSLIRRVLPCGNTTVTLRA